MKCNNISHSIIGLVVLLVFLPGFQVSHSKSAAGSSDGQNSDWPQFRGPEGTGISNAKNLPSVWSKNSANIKWKANISEEGASSPIIRNGRVFLTTARESSKGAILQKFVSFANFGLVFIILLVSFLFYKRNKVTRDALNIKENKPVLFARIDGFLVGFTTLNFMCLVVLITLGPKYINFFLEKVTNFLSIIEFTRLNYFLRWNIGEEIQIWYIAGAVTLLGLAASFGWIKASSTGRILGAILIFVAAFLYLTFAPSRLGNPENTVGLLSKIFFTLPAIGTAIWYITNYLRLRFSDGRLNGGRKGSYLNVAALCTMSILMFISANFLFRQLGYQRSVLCLDLKTGEMLWKKTVFIAPAERKNLYNTYATPTPCTNGKYVIAYFGCGIACLDYEGSIIWKHEYPEYAQNTRYGIGNSPIIVNDLVILVHDREGTTKGSSWITAFDIQSGQPRWKINRDFALNSYSTPVIYQNETGLQLLTSTKRIMAVHDVSSGELLWKLEHPNKQVVTSIVKSGDLVCLAGAIHPPKSIIVMRLNGSDKYSKPDILWESKRGAPGVSSPVIYDDKLFLVTDSGIMTCYDLESGKEHWKIRLRRGKYYPSLVAGDGKVYACNNDGVVTVLAATSELEIIAENELGESCLASPAIVDGRLLIRTTQYLYCIENELALNLNYGNKLL